MKLVVSLLIALVGVAMAVPSAAIEYTCPSDPGFCYFDVGNDGCYDPPADTGPINDLLEAGPYPPVGPPVPGSIICPPDGGKIEQEFGVLANWETAPGGSIEFYLSRLDLRIGTVSSGGRLVLATKIRNRQHGFAWIADQDILIDGVYDGARVGDAVMESVNGDVVLEAGSKIRGTSRTEIRTQNGGEIRAEGARFQSSQGTDLLASGDVILESSAISPTKRILIRGANVSISGKTKLKSDRETTLEALAGDVSIERLNARAVAFAATGTNVTVGLPDSSGKLRPSKITAPLQLDIIAGAAITLRRLRTKVENEVVLQSSGTQIDALDCQFRGTDIGSSVELIGGAGSVCDLTGTKVLGTTLITACDTVVGP